MRPWAFEAKAKARDFVLKVSLILKTVVEDPILGDDKSVEAREVRCSLTERQTDVSVSK